MDLPTITLLTLCVTCVAETQSNTNTECRRQRDTALALSCDWTERYFNLHRFLSHFRACQADPLRFSSQIARPMDALSRFTTRKRRVALRHRCHLNQAALDSLAIFGSLDSNQREWVDWCSRRFALETQRYTDRLFSLSLRVAAFSAVDDCTRTCSVHAAVARGQRRRRGHHVMRRCGVLVCMFRVLEPASAS